MVIKSTIFSLITLLCLSSNVFADRIKDITTIEGVRDMSVIGYGLIVGLPGTGDGNVSHTQASLKKMLSTMGVKINQKDKIKSKNVASVMVSGNILPFSRIGQKFDLTITSIGDAKSLKNGSLLLTTLKGADGSTYALGKGRLLASGLSANGNDLSNLSKNRVASGMILGGGTVEKFWTPSFGTDGHIRFLLKNPDFTTSNNIADVINLRLMPGIAFSENSASVVVRAPKNKEGMSPFISSLENIDVTPAEPVAKVIVNSNTGTVVISRMVTVSEALVTHGSLTVEILAPRDYDVEPQPGQDPDLIKRDSRLFKFSSGVNLKSLINNINKLGIGPSDIVAILQSLKAAGAMSADLIIL